MSITFEKMKEEHKVLYSNMWGGTEFCSDDFITNKNWTGSKSKDSFFVKTPETTKVFEKIIPSLAKDLANTFELQNKNLFTEKLRQACGGSGKEAMKIATMHSSSLCSLLFFYNLSGKSDDLSDGNRLVLELGKDNKRYSFYKSLFEFQNVVIGRGSPSNMDVVLLGHEICKDKGVASKPVVLFLESKFSEYYFCTSTTLEDIPKSYLENDFGKVIYEELINGEVDSEVSIFKYSKIKGKNPKKQFGLSVSQPVYLGGIKQMISHYIGVRNLLAGEVVEKRTCEVHKDVVTAVEKGATVLLGSVLFDDLFEKVEDKKKYYGAYEGAHIELAKILNEVSNGVKGVAGTDRLTVLEEPLTYTKLLEEMKKQNFQLDKKVEDYYFRKSKTTDSGTADC